MSNNQKVRHFLDLNDFDEKTLRGILNLALEIKAKLKNGERPALLNDKILAMIFEQTSTRTRVSFDVGMRQLGGETLMLAGSDMQLSLDETLSDTAKVMSRYVDAIMIRISSHEDLLELAGAASIPVINGLTRRSHPCQVMADIMTYEEHRGSIKGKKITWVGDANNVLLSWVEGATIFGANLYISTPKQYAPNQGMLAQIAASNGLVKIIEDPKEAVKDADLVMTDTWVSMGDKDADERRKILAPYRIDKKLMSLAKPDAPFMHCLPAHRGDEVTPEVIDGKQSLVFDEAENRLHVQKAILCYVFGIEKL
ncbi:MAG: ornithine carbamoyltransferase [Devosiaceae bacterium]|nr:ornithine carbamoyltransferase [Devosiaceae bacterium]